MSPLMYAGVDHQPLLDGTNDYFDDGLDEGIIIPPDPFATTSNDAMQENSQLDEDDEGDSVNDYETSLIPCIEKLGLGIGIVVGATVQLATLAGNLVNIAIWGTEAGPYASTTFVVWCCCMSAMFFMAYVALRCLVQMSLKMVYKMEEENQDKDIIVVDVPSDNPMPSPSAFPTIGPSGNAASRVSSTNNGSIRVPRDFDDVLDDVMWFMKLYYILGVNIGISLSWIVTNLALGDQRVSLIFSLAPPILGVVWFKWMKLADAAAYNKLPLWQGDDVGHV